MIFFNHLDSPLLDIPRPAQKVPCFFSEFFRGSFRPVAENTSPLWKVIFHLQEIRDFS